jgi:hypothetical protein
MKFRLMLLAAAMVVAATPAAYSQTVTPGLSAKGDGLWKVTCQVLADGDPKTVILEAGAERFTHRRLTSGRCDYRAGSRSDLTVSLDGADACPFTGATASACSLVVGKAQTGSFKFTVHSAR